MPHFHPGQDDSRRNALGIAVTRPSESPPPAPPEEGNSITSKQYEVAVALVARRFRWNEHHQVTAFLLKSLHGRDFPWLAHRMGVSTNTAMAWFRQGRAIVREKIAAGGIDRDELREAVEERLARFD